MKKADVKVGAIVGAKSEEELKRKDFFMELLYV